MLSLIAVTLVGLTVGDIRNDLSPETQHWATVHRLAGLAAALGVVFVHSIVVTYFIGTSRWCKEVVETYGLDPELIRESKAIKRRAFPWALASMLIVVGIIALGAAADPGALGRVESARWTMPHFIAALFGTAFIGWAMVVEWSHIHDNHLVISAILAEVRRMRLERGLAVDNPQSEVAEPRGAHDTHR